MLTNRQIFLNHLGQTSSSPLMLEIERAEGVFLYGISGEKYLDLISGVSVSNTGHRHPRIVRAIKEQVDSYLHLMVYGEMIQTSQVKYAQKLTGLLPSVLDNCYFVNSGSEAVEGSIKLAKRVTGRSRIISFKDCYHGSTHGALSLQSSEIYKNSFRPLLPDTWQISFNDFGALENIDHHTACAIIEPVQAEGGVIYPEPGFLEALRQRCSDTGSLLIFDEAQTGFGRLGAMFALNLFDVTPDILVLAKALGGGMPLGAFLSSRDIMSSLVSNPQLGHITTFGGHPVCCAAGLESLQVIIDEDLITGVREKSDLFRRELAHPLISEIRGEGLLMAVELVKPEYINYVIAHAPEYGMILDYFLFCGNAFRIAPPLTINNDEIRLACSWIKALLDDAARNTK